MELSRLKNAQMETVDVDIPRSHSSTLHDVDC